MHRSNGVIRPGENEREQRLVSLESKHANRPGAVAFPSLAIALSKAIAQNFITRPVIFFLLPRYLTLSDIFC